MKKTLIASTFLAAIATAGCSNMSDGQQRALSGGAMGAAGGAALGAVTGGDAAAGAAIGGALGAGAGYLTSEEGENWRERTF